jgi:hypothetical protein
MVLGYHVIFGAYGFWLPIDPRGSWSEFVGSWELFRYGRATKTDERASVAHKPRDQIVNLFKGAATGSLLDEKLHPFARWAAVAGKAPKCWADGEWKVFLDTEEAVARAIKYVEDNPVKEGKPLQRWGFVTPFRLV